MSHCTAWIDEDERLADCGCPDGPQLIVQSAIEVATEMLYRLSGQQWPGLCTETRRPLPINIPPGSLPPFLPPYLISADWVVLPRDRVTSVTSMLIDGAAFTDFLFYPPNWLVRTDNNAWPTPQDLDLATTEDDTWSVTYAYGAEPPEGGKMAARVLTSELVKACTNDTTCKIPTGAVRVTQRGVTYDVGGDFRTGLQSVDAWLDSVNPLKRRRKARIISADDVRFIPSIPVGS